MDNSLLDDIREVLAAGKDLTLATTRADGWPQATTVSYASEGLTIYVGCGANSQKARNLARDDRVSLSVTLPYGPWDEIRGLSLAGHARRLSDPDDVSHAAGLFQTKFAPEIGQHLGAAAGDLCIFEIVPELVSLLDYRKGFGHTDLIPITQPSVDRKI